MRLPGNNGSTYALCTLAFLCAAAFIAHGPVAQFAAWLMAGALLYRLTAGVIGVKASLLLLAAVAYYAYWFYYHPNGAYTNDIGGHIAYIKHLKYNFLGAFYYDGIERHHPPTYYFFAALWIYVAQDILGFDFFSALRLLALLIYVFYCIFAIRTVQLFAKDENLACLGYIMVLFWPLSILMATRITNDVPVYALWSAFFYYLLRWQQQSKNMDMAIAIMFAGLSLMIKTNAVALFLILAGMVFYQLIAGRARWRELASPWVLVSYAVVLGSVFVNLGRTLWVYLKHSVTVLFLGGKGDYVPSWQHFMSFDISAYISIPYIGRSLIWRQPDVFSYFAKSILYGEFAWRHDQVASTVNVLFLLFLVILIGGLCWGFLTRRLSFPRIFPLLLMVIILYMMLVRFLLTKHLPHCMDARFAYPIVIPLVLMLLEIITALRAAGHNMLYWFAVGVGFLLPLMGTVHYLAHYLVK